MDAFETDGVIVDIDNDQRADKMARLEADKRNEIRGLSENFLGKLSSGMSNQDGIKSEGGDGCSEDIPTSFDIDEAMNIQRILLQENCIHEVAYPSGQDIELLKQNEAGPAKAYDFKLDSFQIQAVKCIDNNQSVLVSAHTSAGKTAVALYAIATALRSRQRVIYTSPNKALSNQKYRELSDEFPDVGLMTGDVTLNPQADCVVMTTEILRNILYQGAEVIQDVGWVIFDEIHYMRDKERGVIWEESIILLPDKVRYVFLSATIPNARQFAQWICHLHNQPCNFVSTNTRPIPLQHFIHSTGSDGLYEVVDINDRFREDEFSKAMSFLAEGSKVNQKKSAVSNEATVANLVRTMKERDLLPCIVFSFSRKECETYATFLNMDFNNDAEKKSVKMIYENAVGLLSDVDQKLQQTSTILHFLLRGIGIHHSGLLPVIKEVTEILFSEGLIKTLFATETFAMGVNMPARTVLFTSARKYDGTGHRWITSAEYIQMSGRAGRRGKDKRGFVILMVDQQLTTDVAMDIIKGVTEPLNSHFRLTYNMILNLYDKRQLEPKSMLERSFYQFQSYQSLSGLYQIVADSKIKLDQCQVKNLLEIKNYHQFEKDIESETAAIKEFVLKTRHVVPFFQPGRLLKIKWGNHDFGWTVLVCYSKIKNPISTSNEMIYVVEVVVGLSQDSAKNLNNISEIRPPKPGEKTIYEVVPFTFECITGVSVIRIKLPDKVMVFEARQSVGVSNKKVLEKMNNIITEVHPVEHMKIDDESLKARMANLTNLQKRYTEHAIRRRLDFEDIYKRYMNKVAMEEEHRQAELNFEKAKTLLQEDELKRRMTVLRRLEYLDENDQLMTKGRVACEFSSADELLLAEMMFSGAFTKLTPESCAALLSCLVFEERGATGKMNDELSECLRNLQTHARRIAKAALQSKISIDEDKYVDSFGPQLMDVVYKWCSGASFREIVETSEVFEGSIIRCIRRLELVLSEMVNAAKSYGDKSLEEKFTAARTLLKRDIVKQLF